TSFTLNTSSTLDASPALNPSFVLKEPRRGIIEDGLIPLIRSQTDVIVRIHSRAFSAPDVTLWRNGPKDINGKGHVPGLHAAGVITVVGSRCKTLKEGDRVIFSPLCPCRTCIFCKSGVHNLCPQSTVLGIPPVDGTLQKFCVVPGDFCVVLPDHLTFEQGAIVGSYAIAFHVCRQANIKPGNSVIIFGENSCANFCAVVAKTFGATMVVLVGTQNYPNIKSTDTAREIAKSVLKRYKLNTGSHVVIEASGMDIFMNTGIYVLRSSGTFVQIYSTAYGFDRPADFPVRQACMKALVFRGARGCLPEDFTTSIEMLASGDLCMKEVKNVYEFEDAQAAFEEAQK
ncbi:chaperonin 10-like protein, partial [Morchella snyderi]